MNFPLVESTYIGNQLVGMSLRTNGSPGQNASTLMVKSFGCYCISARNDIAAVDGSVLKHQAKVLDHNHLKLYNIQCVSLKANHLKKWGAKPPA